MNITHNNLEFFQNLIFIVVWAFLLLLIPLRSIFPSLDYFFNPFFDWTLYGWLILFLAFETLLWGGFKLIRRLPKGRPLESLTNIFKTTLVFIGFKKRDRFFEIVFGLVIGISLAICTLLSRSYFEHLSIYVIDPRLITYLLLTGLDVWVFVMLTPLLEEVIYRGLFLNRLISVFSTNKSFAGAIAIFSTSFIFGWSHIELPLYKAFGGLILGVVYVLRWRKNILATVVAHISANILFVFLQLQ